MEFPSFNLFDKFKREHSSVDEFERSNPLNESLAKHGMFIQRSSSDSDLLANKPNMRRCNLKFASEMAEWGLGVVKRASEASMREFESAAERAEHFVENQESTMEAVLDYLRAMGKEMDSVWERVVLGEYAWELRQALCEDLKGRICHTMYLHVKDMDPFPFFEWMSENPQYVNLNTVEYESLGPLFERLEIFIINRLRIAHPVYVLRDPVDKRRCQSRFLDGLDPICRRMVCRLDRKMSNSISRKANSDAQQNPRQISFDEHEGQVGSAVRQRSYGHQRRR